MVVVGSQYRVLHALLLPEECGGDLEASSGTLVSPGYPSGYPHHHICRWVIRGPEGRSVRLQFLDFDLEAPVVTGNKSRCRYDYVYVSEW